MQLGDDSQINFPDRLLFHAMAELDIDRHAVAFSSAFNGYISAGVR